VSAPKAEEPIKPKVVDPMEVEYRKFLPVASQLFQHDKAFTKKGLEKWKARRKTYSATDLGAAFLNLQKEPDRWKIRINGWRAMTWWLKHDERIEEMQGCHLKAGPGLTVIPN